MTIESLLIFLAVGAIAGWLAGVIMKGNGFGLLGDIILGIIGAFIGGILFSMLNIVTSTGFIGSIITATIGAVILVGILRIVKRA